MSETDPLARWRAELSGARDGRQLQDLLLSPKDAASRIAALPAAELHHYLRRIGLEDCTEILAMATGEQIRTCLDLEIWTGDRLDVSRLDPWLRALMQAGPDVLGERLLALDDEVINWLVRQSVQVIVVEEPDDFVPPAGDSVLTLDGRMCLYFPAPADRDLPLKLFLDWMMRTHPAWCYNLLVFAGAALDSNLEERAYRWRSGRMADAGYVDYYEALAVYTPPPAHHAAAPPPPELDEPAPAHWLAQISAARQPADRLAAATAALSPERREAFALSLTHLINSALSADRVEPWDDESHREVLDRVRAGLGLGLEAIAGEQPGAGVDAEVLAGTTASLVFRHGYGRILAAAAPMRPALRRQALAGPGGRVDGVDLAPLRGWAQALTRRHPEGPEGPLTTGAELAEAAAAARQISHLAQAAGPERPLEVGLGAWVLTALTRDLLGLEGAGPLPVGRLVEAHQILFEAGGVRESARERALVLWRQAGLEDAGALERLLAEAAARIGAVEVEALEPRFLDLWWIGP